MRSQETVDFQSLLLTHKGYDTKTVWPPEFVGLVFGLFKCRCYQRSNDISFLVVDLSVPCRAWDVISKDVRFQPNAARISQWFNVTVVRKLVAELNYFGDAAEVLNQPDRFAEGLAGQIVD